MLNDIIMLFLKRGSIGEVAQLVAKFNSVEKNRFLRQVSKEFGNKIMDDLEQSMAKYIDADIIDANYEIKP